MDEIRITVPLEGAIHAALSEQAKINSRAVSREAAAILKKRFAAAPTKAARPSKRKGVAA